VTKNGKSISEKAELAEYAKDYDAAYYKFTGKQRDTETASTPGGTDGLDDFSARYNSSNFGRFMSPDALGGSLSDPQTLDKYSYTRNSPTNLTDPTGLYVCADDPTDGSSHCASKQDQAFEAHLDSLRNSSNPDVARAAASYGAANADNGVTVRFADLSKGGENGTTVSTIGTDANGQLRAESDVTINSGAKGADFDAAIGHEGSHAADAQDVVRSGLTEDGEKIYAGENITPYASEQRAWGVTNSILASENESRKYLCGAGTCQLGTAVKVPGLLPAIVDQILANNPRYNQGGKPVSSTNQGASVVNGVAGQRPRATVPQ
jgi:RHS repeat-associated protein